MGVAVEESVAEPDWMAIAIVVLGVTSFAVAQGLTYPLISLVLENRSVPAGMIGLNAAGLAVGLAAGTLMISRLTALLRGDHLIVAGLLGSAASLACFAISDHLLVWFVARFALGFCVGIVFAMSEAWLNTACPDRLRGRVSGIYAAGMGIGFASGPLVIPFFGAENGFAFAFMAVNDALIAFVTVLLLRKTRTWPERVPPGAILRFITVAPVLVVIVTLFGFADIVAISTMPVYFVRTGHSEAFAALSVSIMSFPTALAQPFIGILLDKWPRKLVVILCGAVAGLTFLSIPALASGTAILLALACLGAAAFALYTCALTLLGEQYRGGMLAAGSAVFSLAYAIGSASGSISSGLLMQRIAPAAVPVGTGLLIVLVVAGLVLGWRSARPV